MCIVGWRIYGVKLRKNSFCCSVVTGGRGGSASVCRGDGEGGWKSPKRAKGDY